MQRDESHAAILRERKRIGCRGCAYRTFLGGFWGLLGLFALGGPAADAVGASGLDIVWQRGDNSTRLAVVAFSPDGQIVASGAADVQLRRTGDGKLLRTLEHHLTGGAGVLSVAFSPDGQFLASGDGRGTARIWRVSDGQLLRSMDGILAAFSPDGKILATCNKHGKVLLWRVSDGQRLQTLTAGREGQNPAFAFSPDGQTIATSQRDIRLWRASDGRLLRTLQGPTSWLLVLAFSPDGQILASAQDDTIWLWRAADGTLLRKLTGEGGFVTSVAFAPDGKLLVSGVDGNVAGLGRGKVNVWRVAEGLSLLSDDPGGGVWSLAFSPDGRYLCYGLRDGGMVVMAHSP